MATLFPTYSSWPSHVGEAEGEEGAETFAEDGTLFNGVAHLSTQDLSAFFTMDLR